MTSLERLALSLIFDAEQDGETLYFHTAFGPSDAIGLSIDKLRAAFEASAPIASTATNYVAERDSHKRFGGNRLAAHIDLERFGERANRTLSRAAGGSSGGGGSRRRHAARAGREVSGGAICRAACRS